MLVRFHDYLAETGDPATNAERAELARQLVIAPDPDRMPEFSYRTEWVSDDATISVLTQALIVVNRIREDRIAAGTWEATETWLNERLGRAWRLRGPHPGLGPVLEAMGLRMGTSLAHLLAARDTRFADDPWTVVVLVLMAGRYHRLADSSRTWTPSGHFGTTYPLTAGGWRSPRHCPCSR